MNKKDEHIKTSEYQVLIPNEPESYNLAKIARDSAELDDDFERNNDLGSHETGQWANVVHQHHRNYSVNSERTVCSPTHSEDTLHDVKIGQNTISRKVLLLVGRGAFAVVERSLVLAGFAQLMLGVVTYSGKVFPFMAVTKRLSLSCRRLPRKLRKWLLGASDQYVPFPNLKFVNLLGDSLSMFTEGGIFWSFGLLTFARFLGSFADLGWAWNRLPSENQYTAEFVESAVIFLYGATNTWMERFGAHPGDPFTTKQIQHISIAVRIRIFLQVFSFISAFLRSCFVLLV